MLSFFPDTTLNVVNDQILKTKYKAWSTSVPETDQEAHISLINKWMHSVLLPQLSWGL